MSDEDKDRKGDQEGTEPATAGNICINRNSAGGTCAHYYSEHIEGGNQCVECDCAYFIPNG